MSESWFILLGLAGLAFALGLLTLVAAAGLL